MPFQKIDFFSVQICWRSYVAWVDPDEHTKDESLERDDTLDIVPMTTETLLSLGTPDSRFRLLGWYESFLHHKPRACTCVKCICILCVKTCYSIVCTKKASSHYMFLLRMCVSLYNSKT